MPCISYYLDPNEREVEASKVLALLEEIKTGELPTWFGNGAHHLVYKKTSQEMLDEHTAELCKLLSKEDVTIFSLEMQMWYREHKKADSRREAQEKREKSKYHILCLKMTYDEYHGKSELILFEWKFISSMIDLLHHVLDIDMLTESEKKLWDEVKNFTKKPVIEIHKK